MYPSALKGQNVRAFLTIAASASTNGSGALSSAITMDPSGCTDWTYFSSLYDEFRVIGGKCHIYPYSPFDTTRTGNNAIAFDNDSATPGTLDQTLQYGTAKGWITPKGVQYSFKRPNITPSAYWCDCGAPSTSLGGVLIVGSLGPASLVTVVSYMTYYLEFRSRR